MSLSEKKYKITGWHGETQLLTAKNLYERILEDSKTDYNWLASATELVKICNEPDFPEMYATNIKIIILNCFANLELQQERCYNQLQDIAGMKNAFRFILDLHIKKLAKTGKKQS